MLKKQESLIMSPYLELYDILVEEEHELRLIKESVDFTFVYEELKDKYCLIDGRNAVDPIQMFKYLFLKNKYDLSDRHLIQRVKTDMAFKYFLDMPPEGLPIHATVLTKFRTQRLKDVKLLDLLIAETMRIAVAKGVTKSQTIIIDSTHTRSRYNMKRPVEVLRDHSKKLRKAVYAVDETMSSRMPEKNARFLLDEEKDYTKNLIEAVENMPVMWSTAVQEKLDLLKEKMEDITEESFECFDEDAKAGHKSKEQSFFGYKSHLAMTDERIITAAVITTGEKDDGKYLKELVEKSKKNGVKVKTIIGDKAYASRENLEFVAKGETEEEKMHLVSRMTDMVTNGLRKEEDKWIFNKDAGMVVCPAGHLATRKANKKANKKKSKNACVTFYFDVEKCQHCPLREGCYKDGQRSKSYAITILSDTHQKQKNFQETAEFKELSKKRYMIEAKNAELKSCYGYDRAQSSGLLAMDIQAAMAIFDANLKRIMRLEKEKNEKE